MKTHTATWAKTAVVGMGILLLSVLGAGPASASTWTFGNEADCRVHQTQQYKRVDREKAAFEKEAEEYWARGELAPASPSWPGYSACARRHGGTWEYSEFSAR